MGLKQPPPRNQEKKIFPVKSGPDSSKRAWFRRSAAFFVEAPSFSTKREVFRRSTAYFVEAWRISSKREVFRRGAKFFVETGRISTKRGLLRLNFLRFLLGNPQKRPKSAPTPRKGQKEGFLTPEPVAGGGTEGPAGVGAPSGGKDAVGR
jgi:hypothetical protein